MTEQKYFEDMWLSLEKELTSFDSFSPNEFSQAQPSSSIDSPSNNPDQPNLEPSTYEELLQIQNSPPPSNDRLRSSDRKERIQAIRELYNKEPTIIIGTSLGRLQRVANSLYKRGHVKYANHLVATIERSVNKHFSYVMEDGDLYKVFNFDQSDNDAATDKAISVEVIDKNEKSSIRKEFDNISDALEFFKSPHTEE